MFLLLSALLLPDVPLRTDEDDEDDKGEDAGNGDACCLDDFFHVLCFVDDLLAAKVSLSPQKDFPLDVNTLRGKKKYAQRKICTFRGKTR